MRTLFFATALVLALPACPTPAGSDAGDDDAGEGGDGDFCRPDLPPPSDPCLPECALNELGVGQPCTAGGGQCTGLGAFFCTVDFADTDLAFCTLACVADDQCGEGAVCDIDPEDPGLGAGCVPVTCVGPPTDGGDQEPDAGAIDAGGDDAGGGDAGSEDADAGQGG